MDFESSLERWMRSVPGCLGAGYFDMESGLLLGGSAVEFYPQSAIEVLAGGVADLFQSSSLEMLEPLFQPSSGGEQDGAPYFQEMVVLSDDLVHVFIRGERHRDHLICLVCRKGANLGLVLANARKCVETVALAA